MKINFPIEITAADTNKRTISGKIVTWDEQGSTSAGLTVFEKDSIDFSKPVKLLLEHERTKPLGKLVDNPSGAVVLVAFKHESSVDQLRHASEILHRTGHQILGIVLSDSNL
jgi:hypothetical protein